MQNRCLISFTNDDALIWRLEMSMESLSSELCSAVKLLYVLRFSCQTLFKTGIEYEKQRYLITHTLLVPTQTLSAWPT